MPLGISFRKVWSRRGFRTLTYVLVTGAIVTGSLAWTIRQPFFSKWMVRRLDEALKAETGLGFQAESMEIHPLEGRLVARNIAWGEDLLKARKVEIRFNTLSLLGSNPSIQRLEVEAPITVLDAERLRRIRIREKPKTAASPQVSIDAMEIHDALVRIDEPAWKLRRTEFHYSLEGKGTGPNSLAIRISVPEIRVGEHKGSAFLEGNVSETLLDLRKGDLKIDENRVLLNGQYGIKSRQVVSELRSSFSLEKVLDLVAPARTSSASGQMSLHAKVHGPVDRFSWDCEIQGRDVEIKGSRLRPGSIQIVARGSTQRAELKNLAWSGPDGQLEALGEWTRKSGGKFSFKGIRISTAALAAYTRADLLKEVLADLQGEIELPADPYSSKFMESIQCKAHFRLNRESQDLGGASLTMKDGRLRSDDVDISLPELQVRGGVSAHLVGGRLSDLSAQASTSTDAREVAKILKAWKIITLDMSGQVQADAKLSWTRRDGLMLDGRAELTNPRWIGAQADTLSATATIRKDQLDITDISLRKGEGRGSGELWLTWAKLPPGSREIDMCYRAFRLPVEEGLKAADLSPKLLKDMDASGMGSGWVRIHGPYDHLMLEGQAVVEQAKTFGIRFPAASADLRLDIEDMRLGAEDVRIAGSIADLALGDHRPTGMLALRGKLEMDLERETWDAQMRGSADSSLLGLPGPRLQAQIEGRLQGPITTPFGGWDVPEGELVITKGRIFLQQQSIEGLNGNLALKDGFLQARLSSEGKGIPLFQLQAWRSGARVVGSARLVLQPESADTVHLAGRLTKDLLKDARIGLSVDGEWNPEGLVWNGTLDQFSSHFEGFYLQMRGQSSLSGNASAANIDLVLEGIPKEKDAVSTSGSTARIQLSGKLPFSQTDTLDLRGQGSVDLKNLKQVLDRFLDLDQYSLLADMQPEGIAGINLGLAGTYDDPMINGTLTLVDGRLQIRTYPQSIEALDFTLRFQGRDIFLPESDPLRGQLAQGFLRVYGRAKWDFGGLSNYDFKFLLEDFQLRDIPEGFEMQGTLDASLKGSDKDGGVLKGILKANRMLYHADINLTDLILANAMGSATTLSSLDPEDPLSRIDLDLDLELREPWLFETNLLKLQGKPTGSFKILGTLARPGLKGKMDFLPGGRLTNLLPAGDVVLERGSIDFTDPRILNPVINLQGRVDVPPFLVNLNISGSLDQLSFLPSSTPSLRQDEIIAILVDPDLAQSIGTTSGPSQNAMTYGLASTGSGLLTTLAFANFQERIRKTFNLDRVSVAWRTGSTGTPETNVTVGKTLNFGERRIPLVFNHRRVGELVTIKGQLEWRFGSFVMQLGASQTGNTSLGMSGEIRHTWVPK